jgi:hypothetical protein
MENTKSYLQNMHWVLLLGIACGIPDFLLPLLPADAVYIMGPLKAGLTHLILFLSLGLVTSQWRASMIAWIARLSMHLINLWLFRLEEINVQILFLFQLLEPLPVVLFVGLVSGWKKTGIVYLLGFVTQQMIDQGTWGYGFYTLMANFLSFDQYHGYYKYYTFVYRAASIITWVILICELLNFRNGKAVFNQLRRLNPSNSYPKTGTVVSFWGLKTTLWLSMITGPMVISEYVFFKKYGNGLGDSDRPYFVYAQETFYNLLTPFTILCWFIFLVFTGWLVRKLLLEFIISYNISSKLIYWCSLLPVIGIAVLTVSSLESKQQSSKTEKFVSWQQLSKSSNLSATALVIALLLVQLFIYIKWGNNVLSFGAFASILLLLWVTKDITGFYVNQALNGIALLTIAGSIFFTTWEDNIPAFIAAVLLLQLTFTGWLLPLYHPNEFEFVPPDEVVTENGEFHLFPPMK